MTVLSVQATAPRLLIVEPDRLVRSTVSGVCRDLDLAQVHQAATVAVGLQMLQSQAFDLWLVSLAEGDVALDLIERLRRGEFVTRTDVPVAPQATGHPPTAVAAVQDPRRRGDGRDLVRRAHRAGLNLTR